MKQNVSIPTEFTTLSPQETHTLNHPGVPKLMGLNPPENNFPLLPKTMRLMLSSNQSRLSPTELHRLQLSYRIDSCLLAYTIPSILLQYAAAESVLD